MDGDDRGGFEGPQPQILKDLFERRPPLNPAGAIAERLAAPGVRQLMGQLDYDHLYRWFVGLAPDDQCGTRRPSRRTGIDCGKPTCFRR